MAMLTKMALLIALFSCAPDLAQASCKTVSGAQKSHTDGVGSGYTCKFPGHYEDFTYDGCFASADTGARLWCWVSSDRWGYCSSSCPKANMQKFGFEAYDAVTWTGDHTDIPAGTVGTVLGFTVDQVVAKFPGGEWNFKPEELIKAQHDQSCTSCFVNEVKEVLKNDCVESGLGAAEDVLKEQMQVYLEGILSPADIDAALSVTKSAGASVAKSVAEEACTACFDSVIAKLSKSKCDSSTCYVKSLAATAQMLDWWVDQEAQCKAVVSHFPDAPTATLTTTRTPLYSVTEKDTQMGGANAAVTEPPLAVPSGASVIFIGKGVLAWSLLTISSWLCRP